MARVSALQLVVPAVDPLLDDLRPLLPDGATVLDPAHISFGYPWLEPKAALAVIDDVADALARRQALDITLLGPRRFAPDGRGRMTVWLDPRPATALHALARVVGEASGHPIDDFTPHCSLLRVPAHVDPGPFDRLVALHLPIVTRLDRVELHVQASGGWQHARTLRLGVRTDAYDVCATDT